jgi:alpha-tubulin suppressor-like RCC1 family protein
VTSHVCDFSFLVLLEILWSQTLAIVSSYPHELFLQGINLELRVRLLTPQCLQMTFSNFKLNVKVHAILSAARCAAIYPVAAQLPQIPPAFCICVLETRSTIATRVPLCMDCMASGSRSDGGFSSLGDLRLLRRRTTGLTTGRPGPLAVFKLDQLVEVARAAAALVVFALNGGDKGRGEGRTRKVVLLVLAAVACSANAQQLSTLAVGGFHTCALASPGGTAWCWGWNNEGQLGVGSTTQSLSPVAVSGGRSYSTIAAGSSHTCALASPGGAAWCWGNGLDGQLGDNSFNSQVTPIAVRGGRNFSSIAAGGRHTCALASPGGAAWCWGDNSYGQLGDGSSATNRYTPVATSGGQLYSAIAAGDSHTCALASPGGDAWCWGYNYVGQLGDGSGSNRRIPVAVSGGRSYSAIATGEDHTCALASPGGVPWCWGWNYNGQLDGAFNSGSRRNYSAIAAGQLHTCALAFLGSAAWCWGANVYGQAGDGNSGRNTGPVAVSGGQLYSAIAAGGSHTCALASPGGAAWCWGWNQYGQLGDGSTTLRSVPVAVSGGLTFLAISPSQTPSSTPSQTISATATPSQAPTSSQSHSLTPTPTPSQSVSRSQTQSGTGSQSLSPSQTQTRSQTLTPSVSGSPSPTGSPSQTLTLTPTQTQSMSASLTSSQSQTPSASHTDSPSQTQTRSQSLTATPTASPSQAATSTGSPTPSSTGTPSSSGTVTDSQTQTRSQSQTPSSTATPSQSTTSTGSATPSGTGSPSSSGTTTASSSSTPSQSPTPSTSRAPFQLTLRPLSGSSSRGSVVNTSTPLPLSDSAPFITAAMWLSRCPEGGQVQLSEARVVCRATNSLSTSASYFSAVGVLPTQAAEEAAAAVCDPASNAPVSLPGAAAAVSVGARFGTGRGGGRLDCEVVDGTSEGSGRRLAQVVSVARSTLHLSGWGSCLPTCANSLELFRGTRRR